jgi:hypothetical protein
MDAPNAEEHTLKGTAAADTLDGTSKDMSVSSSTPLRYKTILVPHDGSTTADIALKHAIYLSNLSGAEIIILNVLEHVDNVDSSAVLEFEEIIKVLLTIYDYLLKYNSIL